MKELIAIQSELKVPKTQFNRYGEFNYRSCNDILEAVKPLLKEQGCYITLCDDMIEVCGNPYVKAVATITNGQDVASTTAFAREQLDHKKMSPSQMTGSASSYARKYALNGLLLIDDVKDDDGRDNRNTAPALTTEQVSYLNDAIKFYTEQGKKNYADICKNICDTGNVERAKKAIDTYLNDFASSEATN